MAKKSQKRPMRHERDQSGCMSGLISMFDFRQGRSTQRLLSDRRRGSRHVASGNATNNPDMLTSLAENCQGTSGGDEITIASDETGKLSVKKLMQEEMLCENGLKQELNNVEVESKQSNSEYGSHRRKNRKRTGRSHSKSCELYIEDLDVAEKMEPEKSCVSNSEKQSTNVMDMDDMLEEFCCQIYRLSCLKHEQHDEVQHQPDQMSPDFEEKLGEAIKHFISQRLVNGKHVNGDGDFHSSKELKDALKLLSSDEELFRNFLQRQKSVMVKYVENLWNAQVEKEKEKASKPSNILREEIHDSKERDEGKHRKFFRRKSKSVEKNPLKEPKASEALNRIVILKPGTTASEKPETERSLRSSSSDSQVIVRNKGANERASSYFFFTEIKRRLKQAMGKEQQEISPDGVSNGLPTGRNARRDSEKRFKENVGRKSPSKDHFFIEKMARPPVGVKKGDKLKESEISMENKVANYPRQRLSHIYVEAKKHLSEMLTGGTVDADLSRRQVPKTLGRILSLPEYNFSPVGSPGRDGGQNFVTGQMKLSSNNKFEKQENNVSHLGRMALNADTETESCVPEHSIDSKADASPKQNSSASNELVKNEVEEPIAEMTSEGGLDIVKEVEIVGREDSNNGDLDTVKEVEIVGREDGNNGDLDTVKEVEIAGHKDCNNAGLDILDTLSEPSPSSMTREDNDGNMSEVCIEERHLQCSTHALDEENQPPSSPITSPSTDSNSKKDDFLEVVAVEVIERPSPVSVLEPLFTEEDISPASTRFQPVELLVQPQRIQFEENDLSPEDLVTHLKGIQDKESLFEYVKAVLEASELNWDEFYIMSNSSDPLLDPSIFDEVGLFPLQLCCDKKLLFDCINEALMEVYGRYFGCPLGLSFAKPNVRPAPDIKNAIQEVWEGVYWCLLPLPLPHTLEQIVKKDMAKNGSWMDLRYDSETMIIEVSEAIVKDLMEETALSCVNEVSGVEIPADL